MAVVRLKQAVPSGALVARSKATMKDPRSAISGFDWAIMCIAMIVLQLEWAAEYVFLTPAMLQGGLGPAAASMAWLPSPIAQLALSPWLGRLSDGCSSASHQPGGKAGAAHAESGSLLAGREHGSAVANRSCRCRGGGSWCRATWMCATRRHPFLAGSAATAAAMMLLLVLSDRVVAAIGPAAPGEIQWARVFVMGSAFVILDAANSVNEEFQRSLFTDLSTDAVTRTRGHAWLAGAVGFGGALGYLLGGVDFAAIEDKVPAMTLLFVAALALFVPAQLLLMRRSASIARRVRAATRAHPNTSVIGIKDGEPKHSDFAALTDDSGSDTGGAKFTPVTASAGVAVASTTGDQAGGSGTASHSCVALVGRSSKAFKLLCLQQLFAWMNLWPVWLFATAYFGSSVYGGNPHAPKGSPAREAYDDGVRAGSLSCASMGFVNAVAAGLLARLVSRIGSVKAYVICQCVGAASVLLLMFVKQPVASHVLVALCGFTWAANNSIPFSAVRRVCARDEQGLHTNVLYIVQTAPQLVGALALGPVVGAMGEDYGVAMFVSGACGVMAAICAAAWMPRDVVAQSSASHT